MQPKHEVAEIINKLGDKIQSIGLNTWQLRTLSALGKCRTAALGGHIDACDACGTVQISYNSCRNRHCPKCQGHKREEWIAARETECLPVPYFHVVFTLPSELNTSALHHPKAVYDSLFKAAWQTLEKFGRKKDLRLGMIAILHTWGQNLSLHPHIHCIVPGGGVQKDGKWQNIRKNGKYLFPVKALSKVFRAKYVAGLDKKIKLDADLKSQLFQKEWVVYAKRPFGNTQSVVEYLGRYSHKIAISNHRLLEINDSTVTFSYKDYRKSGAKKQMTLSYEEFIRRFSLHILPKRFVKIRHFGFLSGTWKRLHFKDLQKYFGIKPNPKSKKIPYQRVCPCCKEGKMIVIELFASRGPPDFYLRGITPNTPKS